MNILSVKNLTVCYGKAPALENVSLDVEEGQYLCLVGNNGSGKSTLLKAVMGLVPIEKGSVSTPLSPDDLYHWPSAFQAARRRASSAFPQPSGRSCSPERKKADESFAPSIQRRTKCLPTAP